jgi:polyhydroxyalkanoate synthase
MTNLAPPRQGPRPLPLHLAAEAAILQMSFAGLMPWSSASPLSKPFQLLVAERGKSPTDGADAWPADLDRSSFVDALTRTAKNSLELFSAGIAAYHRHPFRRQRSAPPAIWQNGAATLHAYADRGVATLFVPSLINRAYILDLAQDRSLLEYAARNGLRPYLLDWGEPGSDERSFALGDYVSRVLIPALDHIATTTGQTPRLVGYCMGGTLAMAPAVLRPDLISGLALLAAPWDFHAESAASRQLIALFRPLLTHVIEAAGCAPVDLLQALFASLDPTLAGRKFRGLAVLDPASTAAERFVELEDWLNDGVPLAGPAARETLFEWYGENLTQRGRWQIQDRVITPASVTAPTLAVIPANDRIVPPASAMALAEAIPGAKVHRVALGHVGMMAGGSAARLLYGPLVEWLTAPS